MKKLNEKQRTLVKNAVDSLAKGHIDGATYDKVYRFVENYFSVKPADRGGKFATEFLKKPIKGTGGKKVADVVAMLDARNFALHEKAGRPRKAEDEKAETISVVLDARTRPIIEAAAAEQDRSKGAVVAEAARRFAAQREMTLDDFAAAVRVAAGLAEDAAKIRNLTKRAATKGRVAEVKRIAEKYAVADATVADSVKKVFGVNISDEIFSRLNIDKWSSLS